MIISPSGEMAPERLLLLPLDPPARVRAEAGRFNLANRIAAVAPSGLWLAFRGNSEAEQVQVLTRPGWTLLWRKEPLRPRSLCLRRAYHYPFWTIEATSGRWHFDVARATFDPASVGPAASGRSVRRAREALRLARRNA